MRKNYPVVSQTEQVKVIRVAHLSLNEPDVSTMTAKEAVDQDMFRTSRGTMDVDVHVLTGPHAGALAYLDSNRRVRANYDPETQHPNGSWLWIDDLP